MDEWFVSVGYLLEALSQTYNILRASSSSSGVPFAAVVALRLICVIALCNNKRRSSHHNNQQSCINLSAVNNLGSPCELREE